MNIASSRVHSTLTIKVLKVDWVGEWHGEAVSTTAHPNYVATLQLEEEPLILACEPAPVSLPVHRILYLAIGSVAKVFGDGNPVGKRFTIDLQFELEDGQVQFCSGVTASQLDDIVATQ